MSNQPPTSPRSLLQALKAKPRNQARLKIASQLAQQLQSEPQVLERLRTVRDVGDGYTQADVCRLIQLNGGEFVVEYVSYGEGYETPDDLLEDF